MAFQSRIIARGRLERREIFKSFIKLLRVGIKRFLKSRPANYKSAPKK
jgi:hypothetical protein